MARHSGLASVLGRVWTRLFSSRYLPRSSDRGIFDPYLSLGSAAPLGQEYEVDYQTDDPTIFSDAIPEKRQFWPFRLLVILLVSTLSGRLLFLQITQGQENYSLAEGNRLKTQLVAPPRGLILDRDGQTLVANVPSFSLTLKVSELPRDKNDRASLWQKIATATNQEASVIEALVSRASKQETVTILDSFDRQQALRLELHLNNTAGVEVAKTPIRQYAAVPSLGHLIGYIGKSDAEELKRRINLLPSILVGKSGIERSYDQYLQGIPGRIISEVDSLGRSIRQINDQPALVGQTLLTTLDRPLQELTARALQESIAKSQAKSGAAVAIDVRTGGILAMVSLPDFDVNLFSRPDNTASLTAIFTDPGSPLVNRAVAGQYPSGSTIKPVVAVAALSEKVVTPNTKLDTSEGKITIGSWTFPDWKNHGVTDVRQAIAESNNIFFFALGGGYKSIGGLGADRLSRWLERFGFGSPTGIDIAGEAHGLVPNPSWKKKVKGESWYIGDTYNLSIGQGDFLVTPLQVARATAAIANGGTLLTPHLVKTVLRPTGELEKDVEALLPKQERIVDNQWLSVVREGMRQTALTGSAKSLARLGVEVAAKTGTAQFDQAKEKTHSWFTAFAPYKNPEIAITVIVEGGGEGYAVAAPVAKNMIEHYFRLPLTPIVPNQPSE